MVGGEGQPEEAMGGGDIKMMAMIGAFLGWPGVLMTVFLGAAAGSLVYVPLNLMGTRNWCRSESFSRWVPRSPTSPVMC